MSTVSERRMMDDKIDRIMPVAANGNKNAERYLRDIAFIARKIDDLYDKDTEVGQEEIERLFYLLLIDLPTNPFYLANFQALITQHIVIYNAWMDANSWEHEEDLSKLRASMIMRDYVGEIIPLVAFLTGGSKSMREISLTSRELFLKEE